MHWRMTHVGFFGEDMTVASLFLKRPCSEWVVGTGSRSVRRRIRYCFLVLLLFQSSQACSSAGAEEDDRQSEAVSLLDAFITNMEAIRQFDVFIQTESTWFSDEAPVDESVAFVRFIIDPDKDRCCAVQRVVRSSVVESPQGAVDQRREAVHAVVCTKKEAWFRQFPDQPRSVAPLIDKALYFTNKVPYVPLIGTSRFPASYFPHVEQTMAEHFNAIRSGTRNTTKFDGRNVITIDYAAESSFEVIKFDMEKLVPQSVARTYVHRESKERIPRWRESYRFEPRNGFKLPVRITGEMRESKTVKGIRVWGTKTYDVELTWISLNEPLADKRFDVKLLRNANEVTRMVTPEVVKQDQ